jgi:hypothetical protein
MQKHLEPGQRRVDVGAVALHHRVGKLHCKFQYRQVVALCLCAKPQKDVPGLTSVPPDLGIDYSQCHGAWHGYSVNHYLIV